LAALRIRRGEWAKAAAALAPLPDGDRWRAALLPEAAYRAGDADRYDKELGPWRVAMRAAAGEPTPAVDMLAGSDVPARLRRELALLVRKAALADVVEARWDAAAELLSVDGVAAGHELADGPTLLQGAVRVLGGSRADGIRLLADASRRRPLDRRLTHTLALARLHTLSAPEPPEGPDWAQCVATWVAMLHDDGFWDGVLSDAAGRYGVDVPDDVIEPLRIGLRDLLAARLPTSGTRPASLLFQRELAAAEVLAGCGGLPLTDETDDADDNVVVCGPLRLAELGRHQEFGRFAARTVAELAEELDDLMGSDHPELRRQVRLLIEVRDQLVRCFSQLGFAHCLLVADQPADALAELVDLRCPDCRAAGAPAPQATDVVRPLVCQPGCAGFEPANPSYAGLSDGREQLVFDAVALAVDALCVLSQTELSSAEPKLTEVARLWRAALANAAEIEVRAEIETRVADLALGRADVLSKRDQPERSIPVLETALPVLTDHSRDRVAGRLATLLANRGIRAANEDMDNASALDDLRRSLQLNPHLVRSRSSLCVLLRHRAMRRLEQRSVHDALRLLGESMELATEGLRAAPGQSDLTELLARSTEDYHQLSAAVAEALLRARRR
ncbi:MAG TPA: hypothetical protein VEO01_34190, partial [Pseudonocardiaceae bacterium]|nr:hypothetical protein [Pseudonocardiaceae bacterium]